MPAALPPLPCRSSATLAPSSASAGRRPPASAAHHRVAASCRDRSIVVDLAPAPAEAPLSLDVPNALSPAALPAAAAAERRPVRARAWTVLVRAVWIVAATLWLGTAIALVPSVSSLVVFAVALATFTLPGWPLARWLVGRRAGWVFVAPLALVLGYAAGVTLFLTLRLAGGAVPLVVAGSSVALAAVLMTMLPAADDGLVAVPDADRHDAAALGLLLVTVGLVVAPVFAHVGATTPGGLAYRAYFIADLFAHMSVVAE